MGGPDPDFQGYVYTMLEYYGISYKGLSIRQVAQKFKHLQYIREQEMIALYGTKKK